MEGSGTKEIILRQEGIALSIPCKDGNDRALASISIGPAKNAPWGSIKAFEIRPDEVGFDVPAKLTFTVSDVDLPVGVEKESLRIAALEKGAWKIIEGSRYDPANSSVSAPIRHFSIYGLVASPGVFSGRGTEFEINGITARTEDAVHGRLFVAPAFVSFYAEMDATDGTSVTITGLPTDGEHHVYVGSHDDHTLLTPSDGGEITLPLGLSGPSLVWIQPYPATIVIGGGSEVDQCASYGERAGDVCTLTADIVGDVELRGGTLDCSGHSITQPASYGGMGMGVLVPPNIYGTVIEHCTIGSEAGYFGYGVAAYGADTVVVSDNTLTDNFIGVLFQGVSNSFVSDNHFGGASLWAIALWGSSLSNEASDNTIDVDNDGITIEGLVVAPASSGNRVMDNLVTRGTGGILLGKTTDNIVKQNTISGVLTALSVGSAAWPNDIYRNNFQGSILGVYSTTTESIDLSSETYGGNWWGHSCPGPLFTPGVDGVPESVTDNRAYGQKDAWLHGIQPGCVGDADGDGVPDPEDNCPAVANPDQSNEDGTGEGDACDVTPPAAPVITSPPDGSLLATSWPQILGTAERRSMVTITDCALDGQGAVIYCTAVAQGRTDDSGNFLLTPSTTLAEGYHAFTATAADRAGNVSVSSNVVKVIIDTVAPVRPVIVRPVNGEILNAPYLQVVGTAEPFSTVIVYDDGIDSWTTEAQGKGAFSVEIGPLGNGEHLLGAVSIDLAGHVSPPSENVGVAVSVVSTAAPIRGEKGKLALTSIIDFPDPLDPIHQVSTLQAGISIKGVKGLKGNSPNHLFKVVFDWDIKDSAGDIPVARREYSFPIEAPAGGGQQEIQKDVSLQWNGRDHGGAIAQPGTLYRYDVKLYLARLYVGEGKGPPCSRDELQVEVEGSPACIIDRLTIGREGSIFVDYEPDVSPLCFVSPPKFIHRGNAVAMDLDEDDSPHVLLLQRRAGEKSAERLMRTLYYSTWDPDPYPGGWKSEEIIYPWYAANPDLPCMSMGIPLPDYMCRLIFEEFYYEDRFQIVPNFDISVDNSGIPHICFVSYIPEEEGSPYDRNATLWYGRRTGDPEMGEPPWELYEIYGAEDGISNTYPFVYGHFVKPFGCSIEVDNTRPDAQPIWITFTGVALEPHLYPTNPWYLKIERGDFASDSFKRYNIAAPIGFYKDMPTEEMSDWSLRLSQAIGTQGDLALDYEGNPHVVFRGYAGSPVDSPDHPYSSLFYAFKQPWPDRSWRGEDIRPANENTFYVRPSIDVSGMEPFIVATEVMQDRIRYKGHEHFSESDVVMIHKHGRPDWTASSVGWWGDDAYVGATEGFEGLPSDIKVRGGTGPRKIIDVAYIAQEHFKKRIEEDESPPWNTRYDWIYNDEDDIEGGGLYAYRWDETSGVPVMKHAVVDSLVEKSYSVSLGKGRFGGAQIVYGNNVEGTSEDDIGHGANQVTYFDETSEAFLFPEQWGASHTGDCLHKRLRLGEEQLNLSVWSGADEFGSLIESESVRDFIAGGIVRNWNDPDNPAPSQDDVRDLLLKPLSFVLLNRQHLFSPHGWIPGQKDSETIGLPLPDVVDPVEISLFNEIFRGVEMRNGFPPRKEQTRVCMPSYGDCFLGGGTLTNHYGSYASSQLGVRPEQHPCRFARVDRDPEGRPVFIDYAGGSDSEGLFNPEIVDDDTQWCVTCDYLREDGTYTEGMFKECTEDNDCDTQHNYFCIDFPLLRTLDPDQYDAMGPLGDRFLCAKPHPSCDEYWGDEECPGECGAYRGLTTEKELVRAENACLVRSDPQNGNRLYPNVSLDSFECIAVGCAQCYLNRYCGEDAPCPYGHTCVMDGNVLSPACTLRQFLDYDWTQELLSGIEDAHLQAGVVDLIEDINTSLSAMRFPAFVPYDEGDRWGHMDRVWLKLKDEGYRPDNKTGIHAVTGPFLHPPVAGISQGELWLVFEVDTKEDPYGIYAAGYGWAHLPRGGTCGSPWNLRIPPDPESVEGLFIRVRYQPYVKFDDNGEGRIELARRGVELLKGITPTDLGFDISLTEDDLSNSLDVGCYNCIGCVREEAYKNAKSKLDDMLKDLLGGDAETQLEKIFNILLTQPELSYALFGQRCYPYDSGFFDFHQKDGSGRLYHNIESIAVSGTLNTGYSYSPADFTSPGDGVIDILYRSEAGRNCDPYMHMSVDIPYDSGVPGGPYGQLIPVDTEDDDGIAYPDYPPENEPSLETGKYQTAQCEVNLRTSNPDEFRACLPVTEPGVPY